MCATLEHTLQPMMKVSEYSLIWLVTNKRSSRTYNSVWLSEFRGDGNVRCRYVQKCPQDQTLYGTLTAQPEDGTYILEMASQSQQYWWCARRGWLSFPPLSSCQRDVPLSLWHSVLFFSVASHPWVAPLGWLGVYGEQTVPSCPSLCECCVFALRAGVPGKMNAFTQRKHLKEFK